MAKGRDELRFVKIFRDAKILRDAQEDKAGKYMQAWPG
jgi:hypothetical protein